MREKKGILCFWISFLYISENSFLKDTKKFSVKELYDENYAELHFNCIENDADLTPKELLIYFKNSYENVTKGKRGVPFSLFLFYWNFLSTLIRSSFLAIEAFSFKNLSEEFYQEIQDLNRPWIAKFMIHFRNDKSKDILYFRISVFSSYVRIFSETCPEFSEKMPELLLHWKLHIVLHFNIIWRTERWIPRGRKVRAGNYLPVFSSFSRPGRISDSIRKKRRAVRATCARHTPAGKNGLACESRPSRVLFSQAYEITGRSEQI